MLRRLLACALAALLFVPVSGAFSSIADELHVRFDAAHPPVLVAAGGLSASGVARDGFLSAYASNATIGPIPSLHVLDAANPARAMLDLRGATIVVHSGHVVWMLENSTATLDASAAYGFALALPKSPVGGDSPGLVLAGPGTNTTVHAKGDGAMILPAAAIVSVLDATGKPLEGLDHASINKDGAPEQGSGSGVAFMANGTFDARLAARALATGVDAKAGGLRLVVRPAQEDRFLDTARAIQDAMGALSDASGGEGPQGGPAGELGPLDQIGALSGVFNGAVLILPGDAANASAPLEMKLGDRDLAGGPFTLLRSKELALAWGGGNLQVQGTTSMAVSGEGFVVKPPLVVGFVPIIALLLWLAAIGAVVWFFVKRPPAAKGKWSLRGISWGVYLVVLLAVFWWWDKSFSDTFGTSLITLLKTKGFAGDAFSQVALVFGIEMIPWTFAVLLFALPVRIGLGVLLRYRGEGSSFKGIAKAGGLVSLAIFGPIYALWIANVLIAQVVKYAPKLFGSA